MTDPRLSIGANGGPPLDEEEAQPTFNMAEVNLVHEAAQIWAAKFSADPALIMGKRGKRRNQILRKALCLSLKEILPASTIAAILGNDRGTTEDDQAEALGWQERNEACETGLDAMCDAVRKVLSVKADELETAMMAESANDRELRRIERERRAAERAAKELEDRALTLRRRQRETRVESEIGRMETRLRESGIENWQAMAAQHYGADHTAARLAPKTRAGLLLLIAADRKAKFTDRRIAISALGETSFREMVTFGLARTLTPTREDEGIPRAGITAFGQRVAQCAPKQTEPKRKAAPPSLARIGT